MPDTDAAVVVRYESNLPPQLAQLVGRYVPPPPPPPTSQPIELEVELHQYFKAVVEAAEAAYTAEGRLRDAYEELPDELKSSEDLAAMHSDTLSAVQYYAACWAAARTAYWRLYITQSGAYVHLFSGMSAHNIHTFPCKILEERHLYKYNLSLVSTFIVKCLQDLEDQLAALQKMPSYSTVISQGCKPECLSPLLLEAVRSFFNQDEAA